MIQWRGVREADRAELRDFTCTDPPTRDAAGELDISDEHFAELEAQTGVREGLQFPLPRGERCFVGTDGEGIVAVMWWIELGGPSRVKLLVGAVAKRVRGQRVGDQMMDELIARLLDPVADRDVACVMAHGLIRPANTHSAEMLQRHSFFYVQDDGELQEWYLRLENPARASV